MKYWNQIRILDLHNRTDAELQSGAEQCKSNMHKGLGAMGAGLLGAAVAWLLAPVFVPVIPLLLFIGAPIMLYTGYKQARQNYDGMRAHKNEDFRRTLLMTAPDQGISQSPLSSPAAPVFNGHAAVVLDTDITPMKRIRIIAKAEQPVIR